MNLNINNATAWSEAIFGNCELGDKRLTRRLIKISNQLLNCQDISLAQSCEGLGAQIEGSYRFIRNGRFSADQIASGGYDATGYLAQTVPLLLAIEDSTSLFSFHKKYHHLKVLHGCIQMKYSQRNELPVY